MEEKDYITMKHSKDVDKAKLGRIKKVIAAINRYQEIQNNIKQGKLMHVGLKIKGMKYTYYEVNHPQFKLLEELIIAFCDNNLKHQREILNSLKEKSLLKKDSYKMPKYKITLNKKKIKIKIKNFLNKITLGLVKKYYEGGEDK